MKIEYSKSFLKVFKKSSVKTRNKFKERLALFIVNPHAALLRNHFLKGRWKGYRSINVIGDCRAIFIEIKNYSRIRFFVIGTHSQLYG